MALRRRFRSLATEEPRLVVLSVVTAGSLLTFPLVVLLVRLDGGPFRFGGVDFKAYYLAGLLCLSAVTVAPDPVIRDRPYLAGALAALSVLPKPFAAPAGAHLLGDRL